MRFYHHNVEAAKVKSRTATPVGSVVAGHTSPPVWPATDGPPHRPNSQLLQQV